MPKEPPRRKPGTVIALAKELRRSISNGTYGPGEFVPSVRRLASESGVAFLTVTRALKMLEHEGLVSAEPRKGYRVLHARAKPRATSQIGFLSGSNPDDFRLWNETHKALLTGFQCAAGRIGVAVLAMSISPGSPRDTARAARAAGLAGLALDANQPELIEALREAGVSVVLVDAYTYETEVDGVVQDNFHGGFLAGEHLARHGHREVAWFGLSYETNHSRERMGGAVIGLRSGDARIAPGYEFHVPEETSGVPSNEALREARAFLSDSKRPRAVLALWQSCANALLAAAAELRLRPGDDFDLVTWGIEENRREVYGPRFGPGGIPPMVCWSAKRMAELAISRLVQSVDKKDRVPARLSAPMRLYL